MTQGWGVTQVKQVHVMLTAEWGQQTKTDKGNRYTRTSPRKEDMCHIAPRYLNQTQEAGEGCLETEQTSACWREEAGVQAEAVREEAGST